MKSFKRNNSPGPGTYKLPSIFAPKTDRPYYPKENIRNSNNNR